jgi:hypothetical protein
MRDRIATRRTATLAVVTLLLALSACNAEDSATDAPATTDTPATTSASSSPATAVPAAEDFDPAVFQDPTTVDNQWFPLVPGAQLTWEGHALDGKDKLERTVVFTVTDLVKEIDGVPTVVVWERDYTDGELEEAELSFFAQDDSGNVWHLGEYPEEYEEGEIVKHPLWIAGLQGALPGIHMPASPAVHTPSYAQGWGPAVGWDDRGDTYAVGEHACAEIDCYDNVLVTKEFSRDEPGAFQLKYYAPGVGNVRVGWGGRNEDEHEVLVLTNLVQLDAAGLDEARVKALAQEARGFDLSPQVYGQTQPATQR